MGWNLPKLADTWVRPKSGTARHRRNSLVGRRQVRPLVPHAVYSPLIEAALLAMSHLYSTPHPTAAKSSPHEIQRVLVERLSCCCHNICTHMELLYRWAGLDCMGYHVCGACLRGPILEVIVSRMRYIAAHTASNVRFVGLSTAVANAQDLADWLGIGPKVALPFLPFVLVQTIPRSSGRLAIGCSFLVH